jgi:hypothetical protein
VSVPRKIPSPPVKDLSRRAGTINICLDLENNIPILDGLFNLIPKEIAWKK